MEGRMRHLELSLVHPAAIADADVLAGTILLQQLAAMQQLTHLSLEIQTGWGAEVEPADFFALTASTLRAGCKSCVCGYMCTMPGSNPTLPQNVWQHVFVPGSVLLLACATADGLRHLKVDIM